jgi:FMN phosphatase YigB (HAD superfamily)
MISFVYFDVGGVLIKDFSASNKWQEMQHDLGITDDMEPKFIELWNQYRDRICLDLDVDDLQFILAKELNLTLPANYSCVDDFINRFETNPSIWPVVSAFQTHCKVGLLTNMYPRMLSKIIERQLLPPLQWNEVVDSSIVGFQKPDLQIFQCAQTHATVPVNQLLFIDNSIEHVEAAKKLGWQVFLYDSHDYHTSSAALMNLCHELFPSK